jgi:hypothetical protein
MSHQQAQNESHEDRNTNEQEPLFMTDHKGIVLVWADRRARRFSWSLLRRLAMHSELLTPQGQE